MRQMKVWVGCLTVFVLLFESRWSYPIVHHAEDHRIHKYDGFHVSKTENQENFIPVRDDVLDPMPSRQNHRNIHFPGQVRGQHYPIAPESSDKREENVRDQEVHPRPQFIGSSSIYTSITHDRQESDASTTSPSTGFQRNIGSNQKFDAGAPVNNPTPQGYRKHQIIHPSNNSHVQNFNSGVSKEEYSLPYSINHAESNHDHQPKTQHAIMRGYRLQGVPGDQMVSVTQSSIELPYPSHYQSSERSSPPQSVTTGIQPLQANSKSDASVTNAGYSRSITNIPTAHQDKVRLSQIDWSPIQNRQSRRHNSGKFFKESNHNRGQSVPYSIGQGSGEFHKDSNRDQGESSPYSRGHGSGEFRKDANQNQGQSIPYSRGQGSEEFNRDGSHNQRQYDPYLRGQGSGEFHKDGNRDQGGSSPYSRGHGSGEFRKDANHNQGQSIPYSRGQGSEEFNRDGSHNQRQDAPYSRGQGSGEFNRNGNRNQAQHVPYSKGLGSGEFHRDTSHNQGHLRGQDSVLGLRGQRGEYQGQPIKHIMHQGERVEVIELQDFPNEDPATNLRNGQGTSPHFNYKQQGMNPNPGDRHQFPHQVQQYPSPLGHNRYDYGHFKGPSSNRDPRPLRAQSTVLRAPGDQYFQQPGPTANPGKYQRQDARERYKNVPERIATPAPTQVSGQSYSSHAPSRVSDSTQTISYELQQQGSHIIRPLNYPNTGNHHQHQGRSYGVPHQFPNLGNPQHESSSYGSQLMPQGAHSEERVVFPGLDSFPVVGHETELVSAVENNKNCHRERMLRNDVQSLRNTLPVA